MLCLTVSEPPCGCEMVRVQIGSVLPVRRLSAIRSRLLRLTHPGNYKGEWTEREKDQLLALHEDMGNAWTKISKQLDRLPTACRDKVRELTTCPGSTTGRWSLDEISLLMESCQKQLVCAHMHGCVILHCVKHL
jgi:Myb-like DNA-binding domain